MSKESEEPRKKKRKVGGPEAVAAPGEQNKYSTTENGTKIEVSGALTQNELVNLVTQHGTKVKKLSFLYEEESEPISFTDFEFPNLEDLEFNRCALDVFILVNAPNLKSLTIEHCSYSPIAFIKFRLPGLESLYFEFCTINDPSDLGESLSSSPLIEKIYAYKLWGLGDFLGKKTVYLPNCQELDFYRSDDLSSLKLYAPRLESLNLRACYSMTKLSFGKRGKKEHSEWNLKSPEKPTSFTVNVVNSGIRGTCRDYLKNHPRVSFILWRDEDHDMFMFDIDPQGDDQRAQWTGDDDEEMFTTYF